MINLLVKEKTLSVFDSIRMMLAQCPTGIKYQCE